MTTLVDAFKTLKAWQIGVVVAVLTAAFGGAYGVYSLVSGTGQAGLSEDQQAIPIAYGDLITQVSTSGSLVFPEREVLAFGTQGTIGEVMVEEGQLVEAGQPVARLDATTVAGLELAVAQARVNLRSAEEAVAKAEDPHSALDMAQAEAKVADARLALESARASLEGLLEPVADNLAQAKAQVADDRLALGRVQDSLGELLEPTPSDLAQAQAKVPSLRLALQKAHDELAELLEPGDQETAQSEAAVTAAKMSVENAEEALAAARTGPDSVELSRAQSQLDSADTVLANAGADLYLTQKEWNDKVEAAHDSFDEAKQAYADVFQKWLGIGLEDGETALAPDTLLIAWGIDLGSLFDPSLRFLDSTRGFLAAGLPPEDSATPWSELVIYAWMNLTPGYIIASCYNIPITADTQCVRKEMDDGWDALSSATDSLDTVETQARKAVTTAESAVGRSVESLAAAQEALDDIKAGPDRLDIETIENQLALAQANLAQVEEDLSALMSGPNALEVEAKRAQVEVAQASLAQAEEDLSALISGPDPLEVEAKRAQVEVAQASLAQAEEDLSALMSGPDPLETESWSQRVAVAEASLHETEAELAELRGSVDPLQVALRQADLASAKLALDTALERLQGADLRSPIKGFVSLVIVEAGQRVSENTPVVEIVNPLVVVIDGVVDEIDVLFVREGQDVTVALDALPGQTLRGTISDIASAATNQQGVVTYPIRIRVQTPQGVALREGLSATASIVIREERNVLLVPLQAIYGTFEQPTVRVVVNGGIEERLVTLGNSDDFWVVVEQGIAEGEQVVMESAQTSTGGFGFGDFRRFAGGGFGGGGFPRPQRAPARR